MTRSNQRWAHGHCSHFFGTVLLSLALQSSGRDGVKPETLFVIQPLWKQPNNSEAAVGSLSPLDRLFISWDPPRSRERYSCQVRGLALKKKKPHKSNNHHEWVADKRTCSCARPCVRCFCLLCQHQLYFPLPSCPAHCCLRHKCRQSGIHLIHSASRSISHPPVKSSTQPHAPPCLLCCFILPPRHTHAALTTAKTNKNLCRNTVYKIVSPYKEWAEPPLE